MSPIVGEMSSKVIGFSVTMGFLILCSSVFIFSLVVLEHLYENMCCQHSSNLAEGNAQNEKSQLLTADDKKLEEGNYSMEKSSQARSKHSCSRSLTEIPQLRLNSGI